MGIYHEMHSKKLFFFFSLPLLIHVPLKALSVITQVGKGHKNNVYKRRVSLTIKITTSRSEELLFRRRHFSWAVKRAAFNSRGGD